MPRQKRLNVPGMVVHVIAKGLDHLKLFKHHDDYEEFINRLEISLESTNILCIAWVLLPDHFHLLLRMSQTPLGQMMKKLLTGYALYYNKKYKRHGPLFLNRYQSIICQEELYLKELVHMIHTHPLRSNLLSPIKNVDHYPYSSHRTLIGQAHHSFQGTDEILFKFSKKKKIGLSKYNEFINNNLSTEYKDKFSGGGLIRSNGGWNKVKEIRKQGKVFRGDERILGDHFFVEQVLKAYKEQLNPQQKLREDGWDLTTLSEKICNRFNCRQSDLKRKSRNNDLAHAKNLIAYWAHHQLGYKVKEIAVYFQVSSSAVSISIQKGRHLVEKNNLCLITY